MDGRPAKPEAVLKLHGDYRKDRHGNRGPTTGGEPLRNPDGLDDEAQEHWNWVRTHRAAWLASSDECALRSLAELWSMWRRLYGLWQADPIDKELRCSALATYSEWAKLAARFGLTPSDRARLGENQAERLKNNELGDLLA